MTTSGCVECARAVTAALDSIEHAQAILPDADTCRRMLAEPWLPAHHRRRIEDVLRQYEA